MKKNRGITLIALVLTIIVLLILAGVSIAMLSGDNGILKQATKASTKTIHANVYEAIQLEYTNYIAEKETNRTKLSLIEYLQEKDIIGDELDGKWQINVIKLLGSKQKYGNGDATKELKDVYMLEEQSINTGSIVNTRVATTVPIKLSKVSTNEITYKVEYYGNNDIENITFASLVDTKIQDENEVSDKEDVTEISVIGDIISISVGSTEHINFYIGPGIYEDIEYISNNESILTIDNEGYMTGVSIGDTSVILKGKKSGKSKEINVKVTPKSELQ